MSKTGFSAEGATGAVLLRWWQGLEDNRGDRAELRRADTVLAVMQLAAFHTIRARLLQAGLGDPRQSGRLAALVALVAHVRGSGVADLSLPAAFSEGDPPAVSPLRFRQLLEARSDDELFTRLRRVLPLVKEKVNVLRLANDVFYWGDEVRKRWVYDYRWPQR